MNNKLSFNPRGENLWIVYKNGTDTYVGKVHEGFFTNRLVFIQSNDYFPYPDEYRQIADFCEKHGGDE